MNLREAAQQALEALEDSHQNINPERSYAEELTRQISGAITVLRAALAEDRPADSGKTSDHIADAGKMVEPVAWMRPDRGHICFHKYPEYVPLYLAPPKREPLTDKVLWEMWIESPSDVLSFARAIERAHGIGGEE